nr:unnamed protein product [Spirometra erinaceieuropaei]
MLSDNSKGGSHLLSFNSSSLDAHTFTPHNGHWTSKPSHRPSPQLVEFETSFKSDSLGSCCRSLGALINNVC